MTPGAPRDPASPPSQGPSLSHICRRFWGSGRGLGEHSGGSRVRKEVLAGQGRCWKDAGGSCWPPPPLAVSGARMQGAGTVAARGPTGQVAGSPGGRVSGPQWPWAGAQVDAGFLPGSAFSQRERPAVTGPERWAPGRAVSDGTDPGMESSDSPCGLQASFSVPVPLADPFPRGSRRAGAAPSKVTSCTIVDPLLGLRNLPDIWGTPLS